MAPSRALPRGAARSRLARPLATLLPLTLLAALVTGAHAMSWAPCGDVAPPPPLLDPADVTLSPDPPQIGNAVAFAITGALSAPVTGGTIGLRVKFEGVDLYEEEGPICEKIEGGCSSAPGGGGGGDDEASPATTTTATTAPTTTTTITYRQDLPPVAPPGHYSVRVIGTTGASTREGATVVCVDVEFDMVMPSRSVSAAAEEEEGEEEEGGGALAAAAEERRSTVVV
jgi:hypothetical protein